MPEPVIRDEINLGLPHLAPFALGDAPMLKHLGHMRWQSFEQLAGVPTAQVADNKGRRLYATFYYIDICYPPFAPANVFRENDSIVVTGDLCARGRNILDGYFAIYRSGDVREKEWGVPDPATAQKFIDAGIPYIRLSNIFIQQEQGPEKLKIGQPSNADFSKIHSLSEQPEGNDRNREARELGYYFPPPENAVPAAPVKIAFDYVVDPDRDVNAAGLVYFANFPAFFEVAERRAMAALPNGGLPRDLADKRGTLRRKIGYFGNAKATDMIRLRAECTLDPEPITAGDITYGLLWFTSAVERSTDQQLIALTTAHRVVVLTNGDADRWRAYAASIRNAPPQNL
ncbi:MAG: LnmK family bifunctional acyltransferase/decarboxylase [Planctomycetota bacterium]